MTLIDEDVLLGALEIDATETLRAVPLVIARASERATSRSFGYSCRCCGFGDGDGALAWHVSNCERTCVCERDRAWLSFG